MTDGEDTPNESELDEFAATLVQETDDKFRQNKQEQQEFLDAVSEEEGAEVLETKCTLVGDYVVPIKAKLDGELMDRMGAIDARLERLEQEDGRAYEFGETADEVSQLLADAVDDTDYHKDLFYRVYRDEGLEALGVLLENVFEALKAERERREGAADGFRQQPGGA